MKNITKITAIVFLLIGTLGIIQSCKKDLSPPDLFTLQISEVTQTSAVSRSVVRDDGGAEVSSGESVGVHLRIPPRVPAKQ